MATVWVLCLQAQAVGCGSPGEEGGGGADGSGGAVGAAGAGGTISSGGAPDGGGGAGSSASASTGSGGSCRGETNGAWAEWRMPNPVATGLPNAASYDTSSPGIVRDQVTGLEWQRDIHPDSYTWADAQAHCASLQLGGARPWRLPSRIELVSIIDFSSSNPAIDAAAFPATPASYFWASSRVALAGCWAWSVNFGNGGTSYAEASYAQRVRCVR